MSCFFPLLSELTFTIGSAAPHSADLPFLCLTALYGNNTQKLLSHFWFLLNNISLVKKPKIILLRNAVQTAHRECTAAHWGLGCAWQVALTRKEGSSFPGEQVLAQTPPCASERISSVVRVHAVLITFLQLPQPLHPISSIGRGFPPSSAWLGFAQV